MRGQNSFPIIRTSNDNKQAFKNVFTDSFNSKNDKIIIKTNYQEAGDTGWVVFSHLELGKIH